MLLLAVLDELCLQVLDLEEDELVLDLCEPARQPHLLHLEDETFLACGHAASWLVTGEVAVVLPGAVNPGLVPASPEASSLTPDRAMQQLEHLLLAGQGVVGQLGDGLARVGHALQSGPYKGVEEYRCRGVHEYRSQSVQVYMSKCVKEFKCGNVQVYRSANVRSAGEHKFKCVVVQVYRTAGVQELWPLLRFSQYVSQ